MTCIFINAFSLREGGSLVVLRELLLAMHALRPDWSWQVVTNEVALPHLPQLQRVEYRVVGRQLLGGWRSLWWYHLVLPQWLQQSGADVLFAQTNYLSLRHCSIPSLLLVQNAGHFSPLFRQLTRAAHPGILPRLALALKGAWVRASLRRASHVTVQTEALRQAILEQTGLNAGSITVIPHGCGLVTPQAVLPQPPAAGELPRIGYITKYGVQKNFGVLFAAVARLRSQGVEARVVLTLGDDPGSRRVLQDARREGVLDLVENHGELPPEEIARLYQGLHAFVFPSLCESFGFPLVEAMASGLPLLVADTPSNVELAGAGALVFAADDAAALARQLLQVLQSPALHAAQAQRSRQRAAAFSWTAAAAANIALLQQLLGRGEGD